MAVPKKKSSVSRKGLRRAGQHHKLYAKNSTTCKESGELTMSHCVSPAGFYKGKKIFESRAEKLEKKAQAAEENTEA